MKDNKDIDFVAQHYRQGRFDTGTGWRRLGIAVTPRRHMVRVAAAIAATVILSATAVVLYRGYSAENVEPSTVQTAAVSPLAEVRVIDFENAPLTEVVDRIEAVYGVRIENLPDNTGDYVLSLHYEGTPADLIAVINDILGTEMTVVEK